MRWMTVAVLAGAAAVAGACGSTATSGTATSTGAANAGQQSQAGPPPSAPPAVTADAVQSAITSAVSGLEPCWSQGGGDVYGAYAQDDLYLGATQQGSSCVADPNPPAGVQGIGSVVDISSYHTAGVAQQAAQSVVSDPSAWQQAWVAGTIEVDVASSATPDETKQIDSGLASVAGLHRIGG